MLGKEGSGWQHAGGCQASPGAAGGELGLGQGLQQQLLPQYWGQPGSVLVHMHMQMHMKSIGFPYVSLLAKIPENIHEFHNLNCVSQMSCLSI